MNKKGKQIPIIITILITLAGLALLIAWSFDKPKNPIFSINEATINDYTLTSNNRLNTRFTLVVKSRNLDPKYTIEYNNVTLSIFHGTYNLANVSSVGASAQDHGQDLFFTAKLAARDLNVSNAMVAADLRNETKAGKLKFEVRIRASVKFEVRRWKHTSYHLGVICSPLVIDFATGKSVNVTNCDDYVNL